MLKIYLTPEKIDYYRSLGVPIHEGPRGGKYILTEELERHQGWDTTQVEELVKDKEKLTQLFFSGFNGKVDIEKVEDGIAIVISGNSKYYKKQGIVFTKDKKLRIFGQDLFNRYEWEIDASNPTVFLVGLDLLIEAIRSPPISYDDVMELTDGPLSEFVPKRENDEEWFDKVRENLVALSIQKGLSLLKSGEVSVDWVDDMSDLKTALEVVFGPWLGENIFDVKLKDNPTFKVDEVFSNPDLYFNLGQMVVLSKGMVKFHFMTHRDLIAVHGKEAISLLAFSRPLDYEVFMPVNIESKLKEYGYIGLLWHEFQHILTHRHWLDNEYLGIWAYRLALGNQLTKYAKTNTNEAISELLAILADRGEDAPKELLEWKESYIRFLYSWNEAE